MKSTFLKDENLLSKLFKIKIKQALPNKNPAHFI